jgi:hypothetical protein
MAEGEGAGVAACLGLGRVGPELEGEVGAGLGGVAVEEPVGEDGLEPRCVDAGDGCAGAVQAELAEEVDIEDWSHLWPPCPSREIREYG